MTPEWKDSVRARVQPWNPNGMTQAELARRIGAHKTQIRKMLEDDQEVSVYVEKICDVLGISLPMVKTPAPSQDELDELIRARSPEERRALVQLIRTFLGT